MPNKFSVAALWLALSGCDGSGVGNKANLMPVIRGSLLLEVDVSGSLRPTRSKSVGPPQAPDMWDFKIAQMPPEGTTIKKGDMVLSFDATELDRRLIERLSERDEAAREIEKKRADVALTRREGEMRVAEAEAAVRKTALKADLPPQYTAEVEVKIVKLDLETAETELRLAKQRLDYQEKLGDAELRYLQERYARADSRARELETAVSRMQVKSPVDGLLIYRSSWKNDKKKIGDSCWAGEGCVEVVDTSTMMGRGEVEETESPQVKTGQPVLFRLEAEPEIEWRATIGEIRPSVFRQSPKSPLKVIGVDLILERTDPSHMRPGMLFRGRIETDRVPDVLLIPIEAVFNRPEGPVAFRQAGSGFEKVPLSLGRRNQRFAEVKSGLSQGDLVFTQDKEEGRR